VTIPGMAKRAAEKIESLTSAAKAAHKNKVLIAALKRCATQNQTLAAILDYKYDSLLQ